MRDDGEDQQHAGEDGEDGEGGDVIGRAEVGRLGGKCEEGEEGEEGEGKSVEGGKWRRSGGGSEKKEEALTLDLTVTSPGEQPSPNPGRIFHLHFHKPRFSRQNPANNLWHTCKNMCRNIQRNIPFAGEPPSPCSINHCDLGSSSDSDSGSDQIISFQMKNYFQCRIK